MVRYFCMILVVVLMPFGAFAATYAVDYEVSSVGFSSTHAGKNFSGEFESWQAEIDFDAEDLAGSSVRVVFDAASAKTGDKLYDKTLPHHDWFDVKDYPQIVFQSTAISVLESGGYQVTGDLTVKGTALPVMFDFVLIDIAGGQVQAIAEFVIDRLAHGIGVESDPTAAWVSTDIAVSLDLTAQILP